MTKKEIEAIKNRNVLLNEILDEFRQLFSNEHASVSNEIVDKILQELIQGNEEKLKLDAKIKSLQKKIRNKGWEKESNKEERE